ncbi:glutathione S-transferase [Cognatazoarcus halotolerans]|uniref:glutathione S-transferase n=1 Tax=Cognatazoarcus halotolerans TaxID=2686016 RepID=UPI00135C21AC|nr:glutathione S-transferase [Cognatazoarcus halotolerans]MBX3679891.1 glutathione S-transferase [Rhodocyclaceae bacterium]MCB1897857.1 glutathione S-transferase [Rhodocyclaceae bacterium]MCP5310652.1 glutathione S-transferase [Zoogloeaceae bacterium]
MKLIASLTSPYARKIRVILAEKGLPFQLEIDIPWSPDTHVPQYNPLGKVPVLVASDGRVWFDSPVIAEYLELLGVAPVLIPADRRAALDVRQTEALADGITDAAVAAFLEANRPDDERSDTALARQREKILRGLNALSAHVQSRNGLNGDGLSLGDVAAGCALAYLDLRQPTIDWRHRHPVLATYAEALLARPSFVSTEPPKS